MGDMSSFLEQVASWASERTDVRAVGRAGSWARGAATPESDVDLVVIVESVRALFTDDSWLARFGEIATASNEDWGVVQSRRVHYADGLEVEFGLTTAEWAIVSLDPGTSQVLANGFEILYDPDGLLRCCVEVGP
jgi:uncharacterized protein